MIRKYMLHPSRAWVVLILFAALPAWAGESPVQALKARVERPTEVLVLATPHLSGREGVTPAHLDGLLAALSRFSPDAIVVEALPPHTIEAMQQQSDLHPEALEAFVGPKFLALVPQSQRQLGLDARGARSALEAECAPGLPKDADSSLRCIRLAAAAWDKPWADYLAWRHARQWPALPKDEPLGSRIAALGESSNENELIGARLAAQFGLSRLYGMDDHPGEDVYGPVFAELIPALEHSSAYAGFKAGARVIREADERTRAAIASRDLLPIYRWMNSAEYGGLVLDEEWRLFVDRDLPRRAGLARVDLWDVRNLAMVSNVLRVVSRHAGGRVLVVVGAGHKPFFDDYLERSIGVRVRQLDGYLTNPVGP